MFFICDKKALSLLSAFIFYLVPFLYGCLLAECLLAECLLAECLLAGCLLAECLLAECLLAECLFTGEPLNFVLFYFCPVWNIMSMLLKYIFILSLVWLQGILFTQRSGSVQLNLVQIRLKVSTWSIIPWDSCLKNKKDCHGFLSLSESCSS